jgi:hypothetical protein
MRTSTLTHCLHPFPLFFLEMWRRRRTKTRALKEKWEKDG